MKYFVIVLETALAAAILFLFGLHYFLLYFFAIFLFVSSRQYDYLRKMVRVFNVSTEVKILALHRKAGVTPDDLNQVMETMKDNTPYDKWESFEKDFHDVMQS